MTSERAVSDEEKKVAIDRILSSEALGRALRSKRLFAFLAENSQSRTVSSTQYEIAEHVFDRTTNFDADIDSLVRVQVSRLRTLLKNFYADEGAEDLVVVSIPKGAYDLVFSYRETAAASAGIRSSSTLSEKSENRPAFFNWRLAGIALLLLAGFALIGGDVGRWLGLSLDSKDGSNPAPGILSVQRCEANGKPASADGETVPPYLFNGIMERLNRSNHIDVYFGTDRDQTPQNLLASFCINPLSFTFPNRKLIAFQLIDMSSTRLVWSRSYELDLKVGPEKSEANIDLIASELKTKLYELAARIASAKPIAETPEELVLLATWVPGYSTVSSDSIAESVSFLKKALSIDPNLGPAHAALASVTSFVNARVEEKDYPFPQVDSEEHVSRALNLSNDNPQVITSIGLHYFHSGDLVQAKTYFKRALELAPHQPLARILQHAMPCTRPSQSQLEMLLEMDRKLDSRSPLQWLLQIQMCRIFVNKGDFKRAEEACTKADAVWHSPDSQLLLAGIHAVAGRNKRARELHKKALQIWPTYSLRKYHEETLPKRCMSSSDEVAQINRDKVFGTLRDLVE